MVSDADQARRLVDGIEELYAGYAEIIRDAVMASEMERPSGDS